MTAARDTSIRDGLLVALVPAAAVATFMVYAAWELNPQGAVHDNGAIDVGYLA